ncbi:MAG TPA: hypothetical protein VF916_05905 [Ktedonobacterales bacterium]|jgi:hypothetical protein
MMTLTNARFAFLDARLAEHLKQQPEFAALVDRLLGIAGVRVVPPGAPDPHLEKLLGHGQLWDGSAKLVRGTPGRCHENAARLYQRNPVWFRVVTGYALSADGLWRQHSWVYDMAPRSRRRTTETTERRVRYYGVMLSEVEAEAFARSNT